MLPTLSHLSLSPCVAGSVRGAEALSLKPPRALLETVKGKGGVIGRGVSTGRDPSVALAFIHHTTNPQGHRKYPALASKPSGEGGRQTARLRPFPHAPLAPTLPRPMSQR